MQTLARVASTPTPLGEPLPEVFPAFTQAGIRPRRGTVTMIAATPASMKTYLILKWVISMGLPTLFFSADTDSQTIVERAGSVVTGDPQETVRKALRSSGRSYYAEQLDEQTGHVRWVFESDPTYDDLVQETMAFSEVHGDFPAVIVLDNLMNLVGENENEWGSMRDHTKALHRLVRITNAWVPVLHHMGESAKDPRFPSPRSAIQGKVSQLPEQILSLAMDSEFGELRVAKVKDRFSKQDPTGENYVSIYVDANTGQFYNNKQAMQTGQAI